MRVSYLLNTDFLIITVSIPLINSSAVIVVEYDNTLSSVKIYEQIFVKGGPNMVWTCIIWLNTVTEENVTHPKGKNNGQTNNEMENCVTYNYV